MSELKAHRIDNIISAYKIGKAFCMKTEEEVYIKSETDKVIARHKYKRCLAMAKWCKRNRVHVSVCGPIDKIDFWEKWHKRWLALAAEPTWAKFLQLIHKEAK